MFEQIKRQLIAKGAPAEVIDWITKFNDRLEKDRPIVIYNSFVQMAVQVAGSCDCDLQYCKSDTAAGWLHANHTFYNRLFWQLIAGKPGMLEKLQRVLIRDLKTTEEYIASRGYGHELLELGVFTDKPSPQLVG